MSRIFRLLVTASLLSSFFAGAARAAVSVTGGAGSTNISADTAANATSPAWTSLTDIDIQEVSGSTTDFAVSQTNVTLVLTAPAGWSFDTGSSPGNAAIAVDHQNGRSITSSSLDPAPTATVISVKFSTDAQTNKQDRISVKNVRVRPNAGLLTSSPSGWITRSGTASITGLPNGANVLQLSSVAGAAKKLSIATQPSSTATAGASFATQPVVHVQDQFGNLRTTDDATVVTAAKNGGGLPALAGLPATASDGVATFTNLSYTKAETIKIAFTSGALTGAISNDVVVSPANASNLLLTTQPGNGVAGSALSPQPVIRTTDPYGNYSNSGSFTPTVTISLQSSDPPGGVLQGTLVYDISSGTATATGLRVDQAGTYRLAVASGGSLAAGGPSLVASHGQTSADLDPATLGTAVSEQFTVTAGPAAHFEKLSADPQNAPAGSDVPAAPSVRLEDDYGNAIAGATVTFTPHNAASGSVTAGSPTTDASGVATVGAWTLGALIGAQQLDVSSGAASTFFTATAECAYRSKAPGGPWSSGSTWYGGADCIPTITSNVLISSGSAVTVDVNAEAKSISFEKAFTNSSVTVESGRTLWVELGVSFVEPANGFSATLDVGDGTASVGSLTMDGKNNRDNILLVDDGTATVRGALTLSGQKQGQKLTISGAGTLEVAADFYSDLTLTLSDESIVRLNGTAPQSIFGSNNPDPFPNLFIANTVSTEEKLWISRSLKIEEGASLDMNGKELLLDGNMIVDGALLDTESVNIQGTGSQTISGSTTPVTIHRLRLDNDLTIETDVHIASDLDLHKHVLRAGTAGEHTITILDGGKVSRAGGPEKGGFVEGNLAKVMADDGSPQGWTFEVGTGSEEYSPIIVEPAAGSSFPTTMTVRAVDGPHPHAPWVNTLQRWWNIIPGGVTEADVEFHYLATDVVGTEELYRLARWFDEDWTWPGGTINGTQHHWTATAIATEGQFTLMAPPPYALVVDAPASVVAGDTFDVTVTAVDEFGNAVPDYDAIAHFTSDDPAAELPDDHDYVAGLSNDAGTHFFDDLATFYLAGLRTLTVGDGLITGSAEIDVEPGPLHHFDVTAAGGGLIGQQIVDEPFQIDVVARDEWENVRTQFAGTVDITSTGNVGTGGGTTAAFTTGRLLGHTVTITNEGNFTITATETGSGKFGTSNAFEVVNRPDLVVTASAQKYSSPGDTEKVSFTVTNLGPAPASGVTLTLALPPGWTSPASTDCPSFPCALGSLAVGKSIVAIVNVKVPAGEDVGRYDLSGTVTSAKDDFNPADNTATVTIRVVECPLIDEMQPAGAGAPLSGELTWESPQAFRYQVYMGPAGSGCSTYVGDSDMRSFAYSGLEAGVEYEWRVVAFRPGCSPVTSACQTFTTACDPPVISIVAETTTGSTFHVNWTAQPGSTGYVLEESATEDFAAATQQTVSGLSAAFNKTVGQPTPFYYRVRGTACSEVWSQTLRVVVQPIASPDSFVFDVPVENGAPEPIVQPFTAGGGEGPAALDSSFVATSSVPWITVTPAAGTLPPAGMELTATIDPSGLPVGTSTGSVTLESATGVTIAAYIFNVQSMNPLAAVPKPLTESSRWIVPAVAHAAGVGSLWRSDLRLFNPAEGTATHHVYFTPSGANGPAAGRHTWVTIEPHATLALDDLVRYAFGFGGMGETAFGALEIRPADQAAGLGVITSRTYNDTPDGTYGQFVPAVPISGFVEYGTRLSLQQVAQNDASRTNVGVVEGSGHPVSMEIRVMSRDGHMLASFPLNLGAFEHRQIDTLLAQHGVSADDARVEIEVTSIAGAVTAYASVIDNGTNDPLAVSPAVAGRNPSDRFVLAGVSHYDTPTNRWRSDVRVFNPGPAVAEAVMLFFPAGGTTPQGVPITVGAGEVLAWDNIVQKTFGLTDTNGALHVVTAAASELTVTARTYDSQQLGTYGQFIPAATTAGAATLGSGARQILHVEQSEAYRSNVGFAEISGHPAAVELTISTGDGRNAWMQLDLAPLEFRQIGSLLASLGLDDSTNARISVRVIAGGGAVVAYSSTIDNGTQDPTYIPAQ